MTARSGWTRLCGHFARSGARALPGKLRSPPAGRRLPFPRRRTRPIFEAMAKPPEKAEKRSRAPDARQGGAADRAGDAGRARRSAQSGDQQGHRGHGFRHRAYSRRRTIRSTAAPIFPPPTRRASRRLAKGFEEAPQRDYAASPITGLDPALAKELGLGDDEDALHLSPLRGEGRERSGAGWGERLRKRFTPSPDRCAIDLSPPGGER